MRTVQLSIADAVYANALKDALCHSGPWRVDVVARPDPSTASVLVLDERNFEQLPVPLAHPERVVLISRQDPHLLAQAWDAGIVSVVSPEDSLPTVLLAIMAAWLRVATLHASPGPSGISPSPEITPARIGPADSFSKSKRCRTQ